MANYDPLSFTVLVDTSGVAAASAKIYYYETGSTTPKAVYSNAGLSSAITQPVTANSLGVMPVVYLSAGRYKRTVTTSADVSLSAYSADPIDSSSMLITASALPSTTYPLMRVHLTSDGHVWRRNAADSAWIDEGAVDSLGNAATITQQLAGTATTAFCTPDSVAGLWQRGTDIASASSISLPSTGGGVFNITGTTSITAIGSASGGRCIKLKFAAALTLTHNASSLVLPGAANITTVAGDTADFVNEAAADATGSNWRCFNYTRASGSPINLTDNLASQATMETGTSTTQTASVFNQKFHPGHPKAWANWTEITTSALTTNYNTASLTDNGTGDTTLTWTTAFSTSAGYSLVGGAKGSGAENPGQCNVRNAASMMLTTTVRVETRGSAGTIFDTDIASIIACGDQ